MSLTRSSITWKQERRRRRRRGGDGHIYNSYIGRHVLWLIAGEEGSEHPFGGEEITFQQQTPSRDVNTYRFALIEFTALSFIPHSISVISPIPMKRKNSFLAAVKSLTWNARIWQGSKATNCNVVADVVELFSIVLTALLRCEKKESAAAAPVLRIVTKPYLKINLEIAYL